MKITKFCLYASSLLAALALSGCETAQTKPDSMTGGTPPKKVATTPPPPPPKETPEQMAQKAARMAAENAVTEGVALYDAGDYNGTIKRLMNAPEIRAEDKDLHIRAYKYTAFSYCVTGRQIPCRQQFEKILKLDSTFDLATGEKGHPQWQNAFDRAKKMRK